MQEIRDAHRLLEDRSAALLDTLALTVLAVGGTLTTDEEVTSVMVATQAVLLQKTLDVALPSRVTG